MSKRTPNQEFAALRAQRPKPAVVARPMIPPTPDIRTYKLEYSKYSNYDNVNSLALMTGNPLDPNVTVYILLTLDVNQYEPWDDVIPSWVTNITLYINSYGNVYSYSNPFTGMGISGLNGPIDFDQPILPQIYDIGFYGNNYSSDNYWDWWGTMYFGDIDESLLITDFRLYNNVCFKEDSKILTDKGYVQVQDLKKGDLVQTVKNGLVPINMIGHKEIHHVLTGERNKNALYKCTKEHYPEVIEDLVITGCHSILVDTLTEEQKEKTNEELGRLMVTDHKYRLMAHLDDRAQLYEKEGSTNIYHIALDHEDYYMNYGIYANGLLVESCSKRYLKELSEMKLIE